MSAPGIKSGGSLDGATDWTELADGNAYCTSCGATVHPAARPIHEAWHATITAMHVAHNRLVKALTQDEGAGR